MGIARQNICYKCRATIWTTRHQKTSRANIFLVFINKLKLKEIKCFTMKRSLLLFRIKFVQIVPEGTNLLSVTRTNIHSVPTMFFISKSNIQLLCTKFAN